MMKQEKYLRVPKYTIDRGLCVVKLGWGRIGMKKKPYY